MKTDNIIQVKSYNFALRIIKLNKYLVSEQKEFSISYREARESHYWIRLLRDSDYISAEQASSLLKDCEELLKIIGSIIKTTKASLRN